MMYRISAFCKVGDDELAQIIFDLKADSFADASSKADTLLEPINLDDLEIDSIQTVQEEKSEGD